MKQVDGIWSRFAREAELEGEVFPGETLVELAGDRRVLIEGHCGVREYSRESIEVGVKNGAVQICGHCLQLRYMSRECLVICGRIQGVFLKRGKNP